MSVDLIVQRGEGEHRGPDIVDGLLSSVAGAIFRGTTQINDNEEVTSVQLTALYRDGVRKGQIILVHDALQGRSWKGLILGLGFYYQDGDLWMDLDVRKPQRQ